MSLSKLDVIYQPSGKAKEYAELACNLYNGCSHGCIFCYAKRFTPKTFYLAANPKKNVVERVKRDISILNDMPTVPEILFTFSGDAYQPAEMNYRFMPPIIQSLIDARLSFTVLTKGGRLACRDFIMLADYPLYRFGTSLVFLEQSDADIWEPKAAPVNDRILAIQQARMYGFPTWVSLEPVIDPEQALQIIRDLHDVVDYWKVGKINYHKELEAAVDWVRFRNDVTDLLETFGAKYYLKKSLTDF